MANVQLNNIDDWVVSWFRTQAKQHRQSLEEELRQTLKDVVLARKRKMADQARADLKRLEQKYGLFSCSAEPIRQDREERG